jgi:hypothetical protein
MSGSSVSGSHESARRRFYEAAGWRPDGAGKTDESWGFPLSEIRYRRDRLADVA